MQRVSLEHRRLNDKIYPSLRGAIAQLGERIVRNDEVVGSIPTSSTNHPLKNFTARRLPDLLLFLAARR